MFESWPGSVERSSVTPIFDGPSAWAARWQAVGDAQRSIDISIFLVGDDLFGLAFLGRLYRRALEGVHVRMLLDGRGSSVLLGARGRDQLQELVGAGVEIESFNPPRRQIVHAILKATAIPVIASDHSKVILIDERLAITGGRNLAGGWFRVDGTGRRYVDVDVILEGPAVRALGAELNEERAEGSSTKLGPERFNRRPRGEELLMIEAAMDAWLRGTVPPEPAAEAEVALEATARAALPEPASRRALAEVRPHLRKLVAQPGLYGTLPLRPLPRADAEVRVLYGPSVVVGRGRPVASALVAALRTVEHDVVIQSPYFVMTGPMLEELESAARRGVRITLMTNSPRSSDNDLTQALFIDSWPELIARIPTLNVLVERGPETLHAKRVVFDDVLTFVGSFNIDPLSEDIDGETVVAIWSPTLNASNRAALAERAKLMLRYDIERDAAGRPAREASGNIIVAFGPAHHVVRQRLDHLRGLKRFLLRFKGFWEPNLVAW